MVNDDCEWRFSTTMSKAEPIVHRLRRNIRELAIILLIATAIVLFLVVIGFAVRACVVHSLQVDAMSITAVIGGLVGMVSAAAFVFWLTTIVWGRGNRVGRADWE